MGARLRVRLYKCVLHYVHVWGIFYYQHVAWREGEEGRRAYDRPAVKLLLAGIALPCLHLALGGYGGLSPSVSLARLLRWWCIGVCAFPKFRHFRSSLR